MKVIFIQEKCINQPDHSIYYVQHKNSYHVRPQLQGLSESDQPGEKKIKLI